MKDWESDIIPNMFKFKLGYFYNKKISIKLKSFGWLMQLNEILHNKKKTTFNNNNK